MADAILNFISSSCGRGAAELKADDFDSRMEKDSKYQTFE